MFFGLENTQQEVSALLENLIQSDNFPSAVLFSGPVCSSRMYASLCLSKALGADINSTVVISDRNHSYRISTALKLLRQAKNNASKKFLFDTVSVFLMQFHGALMDSNSPANKKKFSDAGQCMDLLNELKNVDENSVNVFADKIEKAVSSLIDITKAPSFAKSGAATVNQIRDIRDWASTSNLDNKPKVVILEGLENSTESASNALLKTLEEPPADTHFILISSNPGRIPATILSRVRQFRFTAFTEKEKNYVLSSLFVNPKEYSDLEDFFLVNSGVNDNLLKTCAFSIVNNEKINLPELVRELEKTQAWDRFFNLCISELYKSFESGRISDKICTMLCNEINTAVSKGKIFNQTRRLTFDFVLFRIKEYLS